jgi:hypothetical protein
MSNDVREEYDLLLARISEESNTTVEEIEKNLAAYERSAGSLPLKDKIEVLRKNYSIID